MLGDVVLPGLVCAALAGAGGAAVPRLVAAVPEPHDADDPDKVAYAEIARGHGLGRRSAVLAAVVGLAVGVAVGWAWPLVYLLPAVPLGVALAVIDRHTMRLPTWYLAPAYPVLVSLVVVCGLLGQGADLRRAGLGWLVMGGFYLVTNLLGPGLVGYGDVRLAGLLGIGLGFLGWAPLLVGMYAAFVLFGLPVLALALLRRDAGALRARTPFGPAMLAGAALGVVAGEPLATLLTGGPTSG